MVAGLLKAISDQTIDYISSAVAQNVSLFLHVGTVQYPIMLECIM